MSTTATTAPPPTSSRAPSAPFNSRSNSSSGMPLSYRQVWLDTVEWWSYMVLQADTPELVKQRVQALEDTLTLHSLSGNNNTNNNNTTALLHKHGRLYNRLTLADLWAHVRQYESLQDVAASDWEEILQKLEDVRGQLVRRDANQVQVEDHPADEAVNEKVAALPLLNQDYEGVVSLLKIYKAVEEFRDELSSMIHAEETDLTKTSSSSRTTTNKDDDKEDASSSSSPTKQVSSTSSTDRRLKRMEQAVNDYKAKLSDIASSVDTTALTEFLLTDLYASSRSRQLSTLMQRLLDDLNDVMSDDKQQQVYCDRNVWVRLHGLCRRWNQQVLTPPTLVRLGYGGVVTAATAAASSSTANGRSDFCTAATDNVDDEEEQDNVSVSSWGDGNPEEPNDAADALSPSLEPLPATQPSPQGHAAALDVVHQSEDEEAYLTPAEEEQQGAEEKGDEEEEPLETQAPPEAVEDSEPMPDVDEDDDIQGEVPLVEQGQDKQTVVEEEEDVEPIPYHRRKTRRSQLAEASNESSPRRSRRLRNGSPATLSAAKKVTRKARRDRKRPETEEERGQESEEAKAEEETAVVEANGAQADDDDDAKPSASAVAAAAAAASHESDDENIPSPKETRSRGRKSARGRKRKVLVEWDSDSDSEMEDEAAAAARRKSYPPTFGASARSRRSLSPLGPKPPQKRRRRFTDVEKEAIKAGVKRFGVGNWKEIREKSNGILSSRTAVNIKDCYRNMCNRNEV